MKNYKGFILVGNTRIPLVKGERVANRKGKVSVPYRVAFILGAAMAERAEEIGFDTYPVGVEIRLTSKTAFVFYGEWRLLGMVSRG